MVKGWECANPHFRTTPASWRQLRHQACNALQRGKVKTKMYLRQDTYPISREPPLGAVWSLAESLQDRFASTEMRSVPFSSLSTKFSSHNLSSRLAHWEMCEHYTMQPNAATLWSLRKKTCTQHWSACIYQPTLSTWVAVPSPIEAGTVTRLLRVVNSSFQVTLQATFSLFQKTWTFAITRCAQKCLLHRKEPNLAAVSIRFSNRTARSRSKLEFAPWQVNPGEFAHPRKPSVKECEFVSSSRKVKFQESVE